MVRTIDMSPPRNCKGIMVRIATADDPADATRLARAAIRQVLPKTPKFTVTAMGPDGLVYLRPKTRLSIAKSWEFTRRLSAHDDVEFAEVDSVMPGVQKAEPPSVGPRAAIRRARNKRCSADVEWSLKKAGVLEAWEIRGQKFGRGVKVGHPDTGYTQHPELVGDDRVLVAAGYDFEDNDPDPTDPLARPHPGHGTSTGSVIMSGRGRAAPDQDKHVSGVAPKTKLVPLRVSTSVIHFSFGNVVAAIYRAVEQGCHVISMSLGGPFYSRALDEAVGYAIEHGLIVLAAAGNVWPFVVYPAKLNSVIAVAASNCQDKPWKKSARGRAVDITAPGESVWIARTEGPNDFNIARSSGTSYAVATTAGVCALWLAHHGRTKLIRTYGKRNLASVFKELLKRKGVRTPRGWKQKRYGTGIVDANKVLRARLPRRGPPLARAVARRAMYDPNSMEELADYFPDMPRGRIIEALEKTLAVSSEEFPTAMAEYGDELRFHVATNPDFREKLLQRADRRKRTIRGLRGATPRANKQLMTQGSREFLHMMGAK